MSTNHGMGLDERALLVKLSIGSWSAKATDKEVTIDVINSKGAQTDSGYFRKQLLSKDALKKINKVIGAARTSHLTLTLPWNDDGSRIITTESYQNYAKTMNDYRKALQNAVDEFLEQYEGLIKEAKPSLGKMFKAEDYPEPSELKSKFRFDVEPIPVPVARDFRAKVSDREASQIAKDIERRTNARLDQAMKDVWARIHKVTERMVEKLSEYKPREGLHAAESPFRDSLVENIRDLAEVLPSLNITNDPALDKIQKEMLDNLLVYTADQLREDAKARALTNKKAKQILDKVSKYMA